MNDGGMTPANETAYRELIEVAARAVAFVDIAE